MKTKNCLMVLGILLFSTLSYAEETAEQIPGELGESLALALIVAICLAAVGMGKFP